MCTKSEQPRSAAPVPRVELVDNWHSRWPVVLKLFDRLGQRKVLRLDEDGWLSARQSILVAFVDGKPAAHLCFHIHPVDRQRIEARLDAVGFAADQASDYLADALRQAAVHHALDLNCSGFIGFEPRKSKR
jgi:hypothetical protein